MAEVARHAPFREVASRSPPPPLRGALLLALRCYRRRRNNNNNIAGGQRHHQLPALSHFGNALHYSLWRAHKSSSSNCGVSVQTRPPARPPRLFGRDPLRFKRSTTANANPHRSQTNTHSPFLPPPYPQTHTPTHPHPHTQKNANNTDYAGTHVARVTQEQVQTLQRRSFGHRNLRTYVVVVYDAKSPACRAVEASVEALASGLAHERGAARVMALDASDPSAARFASRILHVGALPALLVYPEGSPGFLAYRGADMTAEGLLSAVNKARLRALPDARPFELRHAVAPLQRFGAVEGATGSDVASGVGVGGVGFFVSPTPLVAPRDGYWTGGKVALWSGMLLLSALMFAWDRGLDERWEAFQLARRVRARRRKQGGDGAGGSDLGEDDLVSLLLLQGARDYREQAAAVKDQQLGWRPLGRSSKMQQQAQELEQEQEGQDQRQRQPQKQPRASSPPAGQGGPTIDAEFASVDEGAGTGGDGDGGGDHSRDGANERGGGGGANVGNGESAA